jgi:hypothetical protein
VLAIWVSVPSTALPTRSTTRGPSLTTVRVRHRDVHCRPNDTAPPPGPPSRPPPKQLGGLGDSGGRESRVSQSVPGAGRGPGRPGWDPASRGGPPSLLPTLAAARKRAGSRAALGCSGRQSLRSSHLPCGGPGAIGFGPLRPGRDIVKRCGGPESELWTRSSSSIRPGSRRTAPTAVLPT